MFWIQRASCFESKSNDFFILAKVCKTKNSRGFFCTKHFWQPCVKFGNESLNNYCTFCLKFSHKSLHLAQTKLMHLHNAFRPFFTRNNKSRISAFCWCFCVGYLWQVCVIVESFLAFFHNFVAKPPRSIEMEWHGCTALEKKGPKARFTQLRPLKKWTIIMHVFYHTLINV